MNFLRPDNWLCIGSCVSYKEQVKETGRNELKGFSPILLYIFKDIFHINWITLKMEGRSPLDYGSIPSLLVCYWWANLLSNILGTMNVFIPYTCTGICFINVKRYTRALLSESWVWVHRVELYVGRTLPSESWTWVHRVEL